MRSAENSLARLFPWSEESSHARVTTQPGRELYVHLPGYRRTSRSVYLQRRIHVECEDFVDRTRVLSCLWIVRDARFILRHLLNVIPNSQNVWTVASLEILLKGLVCTLDQEFQRYERYETNNISLRSRAPA